MDDMTNQDTPKYKIVENEIQKRIEDQVFLDKIPGERTLAEEFGFSYMTVRKAINNLVHKNVLFKVPKKGTFVNHSKDVEHLTIGYFIDQKIKSGISSPYYSMIYNAIEKEAAKYDFTVIYFSDSDPERLNKILKKVDGVIATCFPHNESIIAQMKKQSPLLVIDNASIDQTIPSVVIDNFTADYTTVEYLYKLGHKKVAFMTGLNDSNVGRNRLNGYKQGVIDFDLDQSEDLVFYGNYSFESGIEGANYFLQQDELPQAIICANDAMAVGAIQRFKAAHIRIPEDISVIGFDDIPLASQVTPALTTISVPTQEIAHHAFTMLKQIIDKKPLTFQHVSLSANLVTRDSCAIRAT